MQQYLEIRRLEEAEYVDGKPVLNSMIYEEAKLKAGKSVGSPTFPVNLKDSEKKT